MILAWELAKSRADLERLRARQQEKQGCN